MCKSYHQINHQIKKEKQLTIKITCTLTPTMVSHIERLKGYGYGNTRTSVIEYAVADLYQKTFKKK